MDLLQIYDFSNERGNNPDKLSIFAHRKFTEQKHENKTLEANLPNAIIGLSVSNRNNRGFIFSFGNNFLR